MRLPYPIEYYESMLKNLYAVDYIITPLSEWHGLRSEVNIYCTKHSTYRKVYLKKVFNGAKSTRPCRQCYLDSLSPPHTREEDFSQ